MTASVLIFLLVFLPLPLAVWAWFAGAKSEALRDRIAVIGCFAELICAVLLCLLGGAGSGALLSGSSGALQADVPWIFVSGLHFTAGGFRSIYALVTALMWAGTSLFSLEYFLHEREGLRHYWFFILLTLGATEGVMLSADLMTSFIFFEMLSMTSFTWVIHEETPGAIRAGYTYLFIAVIGGLVLLMGLFLLSDCCGTLFYAELGSAAESCVLNGNGRRMFIAGICILLGFGAKAGMFPLHIWLPKAHPVAPSPASALLSGILTKVGVYGILFTAIEVFSENAFFGLLIFTLGLITMFLGALLALFSVNLKRTLACSSMSQIGFILTGVGMTVYNSCAFAAETGSTTFPSSGVPGGEGVVLALCGGMLHMLNHSMIKLLLFMAAGVVVMNLHTLTLDDIRGYGRKKPVFKVFFALGALGISGVPLFNGYISKTLLHESIVHAQEMTEVLLEHGTASFAGMAGSASLLTGTLAVSHGLFLFLKIAEWVFLVSGGMTFCYMTKLFICIFVEKNRDAARQEAFDADTRGMNGKSTCALAVPAAIMVICGQPAVMKRLAAFMTGYHEIMEFEAFSLVNLKGGGISLLIGAILYLTAVRHVLYRNGSYLDLWPKWLDLEDLVYRPVLTVWLPKIFGELAAVFGENKILTPVCRYGYKGFSELAALLGENKILTPLCKAGMVTATFVGRLLSDSVDLLVVGLRKTFFREMKVKSGEMPEKIGSLQSFLIAARNTAEPIYAGFSFAMLMACLGMIVILVVLLICL